MNLKYKKIKSILIIAFLGFTVFTGCEDFIETNISGDKVIIIAPPDNFQTAVITQTFWWNELEGAESYDIQIVKGTFSFVQQVVTDTSVLTNTFLYSLQPGSYQWRVRGANNGWVSQYTVHTLHIDSTLDLTNQQVVLVEPSNNLVTTQTNINFSWVELYNADEYRFQLFDSISGAIMADLTIPETDVDYSINEGSYIWQVRAINSNSITPASVRYLYIDLTAPSTPQLISPSNNSLLTFGAADSLIWTSDINSVGDSLYIATDSVFTNTEKFYNQFGFHVITEIPGTYFWKLKSIDGAGNNSVFSPYRKFTIQ